MCNHDGCWAHNYACHFVHRLVCIWQPLKTFVAKHRCLNGKTRTCMNISIFNIQIYHLPIFNIQIVYQWWVFMSFPCAFSPKTSHIRTGVASTAHVVGAEIHLELSVPHAPRGVLYEESAGWRNAWNMQAILLRTMDSYSDYSDSWNTNCMTCKFRPQPTVSHRNSEFSDVFSISKAAFHDFSMTAVTGLAMTFRLAIPFGHDGWDDSSRFLLKLRIMWHGKPPCLMVILSGMA